MIVVAAIKPIEVLAIVVFPLAAISIVLVLFFPGHYIIDTVEQPDTLFHILLSILTFCVLCVAGLLALLLAVQEYLLRYKKLTGLLQKLLPLETMEVLLFQVVGLGFVLLSVLLVTSVYFYHAMLFQHILLMQKTLLVVLAWVIFAVLLIGRYRWGWRHRKAIYFTLIGVLLLFVVYFGSKFILGVVRQ